MIWFPVVHLGRRNKHQLSLLSYHYEQRLEKTTTRWYFSSFFRLPGHLVVSSFFHGGRSSSFFWGVWWSLLSSVVAARLLSSVVFFAKNVFGGKNVLHRFTCFPRVNFFFLPWYLESSFFRGNLVSFPLLWQLGFPPSSVVSGSLV